MNKSFSKLMDYLIDLTGDKMLESGARSEMIEKLRVHKELLTSTKRSIEDKGYWGKAKSLVEEYKADKESHARALYPMDKQLITDSVSNWNKSQMKKVISLIYTIHLLTHNF